MWVGSKHSSSREGRGREADQGRGRSQVNVIPEKNLV
jgi:hypothetical protein